MFWFVHTVAVRLVSAKFGWNINKRGEQPVNLYRWSLWYWWPHYRLNHGVDFLVHPHRHPVAGDYPTPGACLVHHYRMRLHPGKRCENGRQCSRLDGKDSESQRRHRGLRRRYGCGDGNDGNGDGEINVEGFLRTEKKEYLMLMEYRRKVYPYFCPLGTNNLLVIV